MKPTDEHLTDEDIFGVPGYDEDPEGREEKLAEKQLRCKDCINLKRVKREGVEWWFCPRVAGAKPNWPVLPCFVRKEEKG